MLIVTLLITARFLVQLGNIQVVQHAALSTDARDEIDGTITLQPSRGTIRDSKGNVLALDVDRESLFVIPHFVDPEQAPKLALVLSGLLNMPAADVLERLTNTEYQWRPIKRWMEPEVAERVAAIKDGCSQDGCLQMHYESHRFYPQGTFAAHVIGAVNDEGVGVSGVEAFYDTELKGITGTMTAEWDKSGNPIWITPPETTPPSNGADLELTLDPMVQHVVETELQKIVEKWKPTKADIIVLDPKTGAIRGMASYPTFDPNNYAKVDPEIYNKNPAVSDVYEPGSTFKIVTVAAGLQARAFTADTQVNDTGFVDRGDGCCRNYDGGGHGPIDPGKVLYYSSNVGALLFNEMTGKDKFYETVQKFGYGAPTGVDIAGEGGGIVNWPGGGAWQPLTMDTNAYGQGIAVTPLQQVRMMAAIANNGIVMKPYIVAKRCHSDQCEVTKPQEVGQAVDPGVAWTIQRMLVHSANHYAGLIWGPRTGDYYSDTWLVPGYQVGAKTGTSDVVDPVNGGYTGRVIGSVLGLAPVDDAKFAILVKVDQPQGDAYGLVAAIPPYQSIADQLLRYDREIPNPGLVGPGQMIGAVNDNG